MEEESPLIYSSSDVDNYVMYKIIPKNKDLKYCYIGHTNNFVFRKRQHYLPCVDVNHNKSHLLLYATICQHGGWDEWEMIELEKFIGKTKLEARIREQELIDEHGANLNMLKAYISEDYRKELKKQITQKYREDNKELLKEQTKKYKAEHKEIIAEQMKKYRAEHKEEIAAKTKEYREKNKEKHQEWQNIWREKNKEILKEKRKQKTAELKAEKLKQQELLQQTPEWQQQQKQIQEEKEKLKKEKRDQFNEQRRVQRLQEKQSTISNKID
jgi:hypothetical protein